MDRNQLDYNLRGALEHNSLGNKVEEIEKILLQIVGDNDGPDWHWIVKLRGKAYAYVVGGCDNTGWDCHSNCEWFEANTIAKAIQFAPLDIQRVFQNMRKNGEDSRRNTGGL